MEQHASTHPASNRSIVFICGAHLDDAFSPLDAELGLKRQANHCKARTLCCHTSKECKGSPWLSQLIGTCHQIFSSLLVTARQAGNGEECSKSRSTSTVIIHQPIPKTDSCCPDLVDRDLNLSQVAVLHTAIS